MPKSPTTKKCLALACKRHISKSKLMCTAHWSIVPQSLKKDLVEHYVVGQQETGRMTPEFRVAVSNMVKNVAFREGVLVAEGSDDRDDGRGGADEYENPE